MLSFTYNYKQPDEYHFCLESIYLADFVASQIKSHSDLGSLRVLDLCAGCGVIGIELSWRLRALRQIDFVEIQSLYTDYFYQNLAEVNRPELELRWHVLNYDALHAKNWQGKFDLIVSNPPYFQPGHGILSPSNFKNRCRFYLDSTFENYIAALANSLANKGKAYFLLRSLKQHGYDLFSEVQKQLAGTQLTATKATTIRSTDVILIEKLE